MKYLVLCLTIFCLGTNAEAKNHYHGHKGHGGMMMKMIKKLDLEKDQKSKLKEIRKSNKEKMKSQMQELGKAKRELHKSMMSDASEESLRDKYRTVQQKSNELHNSKFEVSLKIRSILTLDQRKELRDMIKTKIQRRYQKAMENFE